MDLQSIYSMEVCLLSNLCRRALLSLLLMLLCFSSVAAGTNDPAVPMTLPPSAADLYRFLGIGNAPASGSHGEDASRLAEFISQGFVYSGGLHTTSGTCVAPSTDIIAYTDKGNRVTDSAIQINYATVGCNCDNPGSDVATVVASASQTTPLGNFVRFGSTVYFVNCTDAAGVAIPSDATKLMEVTITNGAIAAVTDARRLTPVGTVVDASRFPGASASAKINSALKSCPSGSCTVDARQLYGTQTLDSDIWSGVTTPNTVLFGYSQFTVTVSQTVPSYTTVRCAFGGGRVGSSITPTTGTVFKWAGAISTPLLRVYNANHVIWSGCTIDMDGIAGSTGILLDGTNTPEGNFNVFENFTVFDAAVGMQWGTSAVNDYQNDGTIIRNFHIRAPALSTTASGIVVNSANAAQWSRIEVGAIQQVNRGIDVQEWGTLASIREVVCGGLAGADPVCIRLESASAALIENCQSEGGVAGTDFIDIVGSPNVVGVVTLINNRFDEIVYVGRAVNIVSIGNYGPLAGITAIEAAVHARITSISDSFNGGTGWPYPGASDSYQLIVLGKKATSGANNLYPFDLNSGALETTQLALTSSAVNPGLSMSNSGAGGQSWSIRYPRTGGLLAGGFVVRNETTVLNPFKIHSDAVENILQLTANGAQLLSVLHAALPGSALNGTLLYCSDCTLASPCASGGTGALAKRINGAWVCN